ncbi:hypothetical protein ASPZODRAFT_15186 [Penicilliopsis zonata CBS 506.65]|uniref:Uncharacterized protein n=1 Tax=Penicilliopsis zonata CBS 506.65 TaxID=1073090 RepID=A0A1L9SKP1_9EURO|nr:hypothetical protein ASPZODRAFT_15186 [Penicilliopsis zonata CBS 506.65]OJJ47737.1 hypothetical protein ASPZODRAFT_15186 [Penicilliopsis zonata CBS 506.65]
MSYTLRFNDVLDPEKLHSSLVELLKIGDWKKLGGRLRRNESGDIVIRVPETYDPEHPAVRYSHVQFDIGIEEHPLACRLPKQTGPYPSAQEGYLSFRSFSVPEDWRDELKHYYTSDKPLISLRVVSFTDATLVAITSPHLVCDAIAMADLLKAWSIVLAGRIDCVPTLLGASRDVIESVGTSSDKEAGNPYFLEHRQIKGFSLLVFIVRFVWDVLIRRNVRPGTIYLPASFVRKLRQEAQEQLAAKAQIVSDLFLSDGDLITAWGSHMVLSCSPRKPAIICNVFELRSRLDGVFSPGGTYLQNLVLPVFSLLSAEEMATMSVGHIALKIRQAIVEQATGAQARRLMRVMRAAIASTGLMPLFGDSASQVIAWSNWSKARIQNRASLIVSFASMMVSRVPFQLSGRYAERNRWEVLNGPGDSRATGNEIIQDEGLVSQWGDKVVLITGVSSGIGVETVRVLARTGATIFGTARNLDKAKEALGDLLDTGRVKLLFMDQTDLSSVRACAEEFLKQSSKLNILINNAAVMNTPESRTKDGFELQFGTNHLSHFLLFYLLREALLETARCTPTFHSRVVSVSSAGHRYSPIPLDNVNFEGNYNGWLAYGSSKTANIYMTNQIERLYGAQGLHGYSVHPGAFVSPNLQKHSQEEMKAVLEDKRALAYLASLDQACATTVYGAVSSELEGKGGLYLEGASVAIHPAPSDGDAMEYGYGSWAFDEAKEVELWKLSKVWAGVE